VVNGKIHSQKEDWRQVEDKDIPAECVTGRPNPKSKNYLSIPSTERAGVANVLGRNCFAVYALLTTAQAMDPTGKWRKLPVRQLTVLRLDRYKIYRAIAKLEAAGIVISRHSPGRKTLYRLMPEL
jgi:hypothetical protein